MEIPQEFQKTVSTMYYLWMCELRGLFGGKVQGVTATSFQPWSPLTRMSDTSPLLGSRVSGSFLREPSLITPFVVFRTYSPAF